MLSDCWCDLYHDPLDICHSLSGKSKRAVLAELDTWLFLDWLQFLLGQQKITQWLKLMFAWRENPKCLVNPPTLS